MTTDLAALSAAATQGEWLIHSALLGHAGDIISPTAKMVSDCHHIARLYAPKPARKPLSDLEARGAANTAIAQIEVNAAFIVALVNAYRSGNLVQINRDGMRERATLGIWHQLGQIEENVRAGQLTMEEVAVLADAAIAAILGGEHDK